VEEVLHLLAPMPHHPNIAADPDSPGLDTNLQRLVPQPSSPLTSDCPRAWHAARGIASGNSALTVLDGWDVIGRTGRTGRGTQTHSGLEAKLAVHRRATELLKEHVGPKGGSRPSR
jgi:hypothetical protein